MTACVVRNPALSLQALKQRQEAALLAAFRRMAPRERVKLLREAMKPRMTGS